MHGQTAAQRQTVVRYFPVKRGISRERNCLIGSGINKRDLIARRDSDDEIVAIGQFPIGCREAQEIDARRAEAGRSECRIRAFKYGCSRTFNLTPTCAERAFEWPAVVTGGAVKLSGRRQGDGLISACDG